MERLLFTSESVTEGHPDKICDQISDAILDALLEQDPMSRVACETATTTGMVLVMGEITTKGYVDIQKIVRDTVREIGYDRGKYGFDAENCAVITAIDEQSADIAMGVDKALEAKEHQMSEDEIEAIGAGDQGMMFGYATNETPELMPYPIALAHKLVRQLTKVRKDGTLPYLRPDGKSQVTVEYDENGRPCRLDAVVLSTQHSEEVSQEQIHEDIRKYVFDQVIPADMVDGNTKFYINPTGRFVIGGPHGDSGLTGRKIIVDTYGGMARHSPERTARRWTAPQPMRPVMWRRILWRPDWRTSVRFSSLTLSAWRGRPRSTWIPSVQESFRTAVWWRLSGRILICVRRELSACWI